MILSIILGILGLGIVILVHETGHFIAARKAGIEVEAFSVGWGPKLLSWKRGTTEYRISAFPIGGYCKMKGEQVLREAWQSGEENIPKEPGAFFTAPPWKRIIVSVAGPGANLLFAVIVLSIIWLAGFSYQTYGNRIILASDYPMESDMTGVNPADKAGLQTGDVITGINGKTVRNYQDIQEMISTAPQETLKLTFQRGGKTHSTTITPQLNIHTGIGRIGVYAWIEPVLGTVKQDSPAWIAGLRKGDRIVEVNGRDIKHTIDFSDILQEAINSHAKNINITYKRGQAVYSTSVPLYSAEGQTPELGFGFAAITFRSPKMGPVRALGKGLSETGSTMALTVKSIGLLFKGVAVRETLSGPIRITYYVGEIATQGFKHGIAKGFGTLFRFLSLLSVAVFFMNLLPIPALDGGMVLLFLIEWIAGKPLKPKIVYRYQTVGITLILGLFIFATFNDVFFLFKK